MSLAPPPNRPAALWQAAAALLWLPQAALIAWALQRLAEAPSDATGPVTLAAAAVAVLGALRAGCDAIGARAAFRAARAWLSTLRERALRALAARSPLDPRRPASGDAASVLAEQAEALVPYLARVQPVMWRVAVLPLAIALAVATLSWVAALALLLAAPLIPLFMVLIGWRAEAASRRHLAQLGGMNAFLLDRLRGLATIRSLGAVDLTARRLREAAESLRRRTMAVLRIAFLSSAVLELFAALGVATVAVYVGLHLLGQIEFGAWRGRLTLGEGLFILMLAPAFFEPLREMSAVWHDRAAGRAALAALEQLSASGLPLPGADDDAPSTVGLPRATDGAAPPAAVVADPLEPPATPRRPPTVAASGLRLAWPGREAAPLAWPELAVASGEHVALVGASGTGKSTLLALLAGLALPSAGEVAIDGCRLGADSAAALRRRIAYIGQAPHLFAGSVRANVALGRPQVDAAAVGHALRVAALDGVARAHAAAPLGEGGQGLSGGEALRVAIARAAADPGADLLLVDEPTAHLDRDTAADVTERLLTLAQGRTLIVATHDPVLAARMDRFVELMQPVVVLRSLA